MNLLHQLPRVVVYAGLCLSLPVFLFGVWGFIRLIRKPPMTPAERAEAERLHRERVEERKLFVAINREARWLARNVPEALARQSRLTRNYETDRRDRRGRRRKKQLIRFDAILLTHTEIWMHIDGRKMPYGVGFSDFEGKSGEQVKANLQGTINRPVEFHTDSYYNFFIRIGLRHALFGVPRRVEWRDVYHKLPKNRPFAVAVGVDSTNRLHHVDIREWPHGLVAGTTGMGKSVQVTQWIATLIKRNEPDRLRFYFVDLKQGVELARFAETPHTLGYADDPEDVQKLLDEMVSTYDKRMRQISAAGLRNIGDWNRTHRGPARLPWIICVIDELADLTLNRDLKKKAVESLDRIGRLGRSAGIHLIVGTQKVSKETIPTRIQLNISGRVVFSVPTFNDSTMIVNNGDAARLGQHRGRCVFLKGGQTIVLQAPIATDKDINEAIDDAKVGADSDTFDELDLFRLALSMGGRASIRDLYTAAGGAMGEKHIRRVLQFCTYDPNKPEESVIELEGKRYILLPSMITPEGSTPRQLIEVNGSLPTADEIEALAVRRPVRRRDAVPEGEPV